MEASARERLIVALDVPTVDAAVSLVERLDNVSFFKIGWELFIASMAGGLDDLWLTLRERSKNVFIDLKVPPDIQNTLVSMVQRVPSNVKLLTLNEQMPIALIKAARAARGGKSEPKLLMVPYLSSLDGTKDLREIYGADDFAAFLRQRAKTALDAGCDGLIASGETAIRLFRREFPTAVIVSPGIRPAGSSHDDHKRLTTPAQAIEFGADYLVVGRPILNSPDPRDAAERIMSEIDAALKNKLIRSGSSSPETNHVAMTARPDQAR